MKTLKIKGIGGHSGVMTNMIVKPTKKGGIVFVRNGVKTPALYSNSRPRFLRNTTVGEGLNEVQTIEHLMASLFICGIKNAEITTDNAETPILNGGADEFIKKLSSLKLKDERAFLRVKKEIIASQPEIKLPLWLRVFNFMRHYKANGFVKLSPVHEKKLELSARLIYPNKIIGDQSANFVFDYDNSKKSKDEFMKEIARTRTFGTVAEWEYVKKRGMGRGANEHNVIGLGTMEDFERLQRLGIGRDAKKENAFFAPGDKVGALTGLYYRNEFVRHKIIDCVGDLYTSGFSIIGKLESHKGSHALNNLLLKKLFSDKDNYDIIE